MKSNSNYYECSVCDWEGPWEQAMCAHEGLLCPECGEALKFIGKQEWRSGMVCLIDEEEEFAEFGHLCLACGNDDEALFEEDCCLNCQKIGEK